MAAGTDNAGAGGDESVDSVRSINDEMVERLMEPERFQDIHE